MKKQFWIIDTGSPGESQGQFGASGPFPSQRSAEAHLVSETRDLWEDSGTSIQTEMERPWCEKQLIVEVVRAVIPAIRAQVKLEDAEL